MKTITLLLSFVVMHFSCLFAQGVDPTPIPGQYIVALKESSATPVALQETVDASRDQTALLNQPKRDVNLAKLAQVRLTLNLGEDKVIAEYADALVGFSASLTPAEVTQLSANPDVEGVYQDYYIQLDPQVEEARPGEFAPEGQTVPCAITNAGGLVA